MGSHNFDEEFRVKQSDIWLSNIESCSRLFDGPLGGNPFSLLVGFGLLPIVFLDALQELFPAGGKSQVLNSDMDTLRDDPVSDLLVDDDAD